MVAVCLQDSIIYLPGDFPKAVYFVLKGAVSLSVEKQLSSQSGKTVKTVVEHVRAPRWFGEEELLAALYGDDMDVDIVPASVRRRLAPRCCAALHCTRAHCDL